MSSPPTHVAFTIINADSGLALHLSDKDDKSIVGGLHLQVPVLRQKWTILRSDDDTLTIRSSFNGQPIGFEGALTDGVKLVTGDPTVAKGWVFRRQSIPDHFKISLVDSSLVIGMLTPATGTPVQLLRQTGERYQIWRIQPDF